MARYDKCDLTRADASDAKRKSNECAISSMDASDDPVVPGALRCLPRIANPAKANDPAGLDPKARLSGSQSPQQRSVCREMLVHSELDDCSFFTNWPVKIPILKLNTGHAKATATAIPRPCPVALCPGRLRPRRADVPQDVAPLLHGAATMAFEGDHACAVLLGQRLIGSNGDGRARPPRGGGSAAGASQEAVGRNRSRLGVV